MTLALGFSTSGAEGLQKKAPKAHVVKISSLCLGPR